MLTVLLWEGAARPGRWPLMSVAAAAVMELIPTDIHPSPLAGSIRLAFMAAVLAAAFAAPIRPARGARPEAGATPAGGPRLRRATPPTIDGRGGPGGS